MLMTDNSYDRVNKLADMCKKDVTLTPDTQKQKESGHDSADYGSGPAQSDANPPGAPGTGRSSKSSY